MSADLFAEFGADTSSTQQQPSGVPAKPVSQPATNFSFLDALSSTSAPITQPQPQPQPLTQAFQSFAPAPTQAAAVEENDDWGDFEGGSTIETAPPAKHDPFSFATPQTTTTQPVQSSWRVTSASQDLFAFDSKPTVQPTHETWQKAPIIKAKKSADPSVLFDAEDDLDDDDDFGDFEEAQDLTSPPIAPVPRSSAIDDLLGDLNESQPKPAVPLSKNGTSLGQPKSNISPTKESLPIGLNVLSSTQKPPNKAPVVAKQKEDDAWDEFDDWEATIPTKTPAKPSAKLSSKPGAIKADIANKVSVTPAPILSPTTEDPQPEELPPTNVPPPGVLLSLFPSFFAEAQEKLFKPMAAQPPPMRNKLMAEQATITYLQGYLILVGVAAHIIAGRKLRWKRDQHLSQGMRIGPASSRATSGMKLTGIDKGENMKEEREVSDVVRAWKEHIGRLRHVVSGVNQIKAGTLGPVPDLQETMPVKTLKQSEGGMPARQPCMMCGLKRDERVTAADMATDDSFGEWWIDQVNMHRGIYYFSTNLSCR